MKRLAPLLRRAALVAASVAVLVGCASGDSRPKPAELGPNPGIVGARLAWTSKVGPVHFPLQVQVEGNSIAVASSDGTLLALDAGTGRPLWQATLPKTQISAGVGSDGRLAAVVTRANDLVVLAQGREQWREPLGALAFTPPLVAGARVFVLGADRSINAFDGRGGRKLWGFSPPSELPLALQQSGVLLAVGDTLVAGISGRLVGVDPMTGSPRWEAPIASPRGANDIERLIDLVGRVSRQGNNVCARAFQAAVGCVDVALGKTIWTKPAAGFEGLDGDEQSVFGTESDGKVIAWRRSDGNVVWTSDRLKFRGLTTPLVIGRSVAIGDAQGYVHLLSRQDGSLLGRVATDGSAIAAAPVLAGNTLVVVTRNGGVFGFRPE